MKFWKNGAANKLNKPWALFLSGLSTYWVKLEFNNGGCRNLYLDVVPILS